MFSEQEKHDFDKSSQAKPIVINSTITIKTKPELFNSLAKLEHVCGLRQL